MNITRNIADMSLNITLTPEELRQAYFTYREQYDMEDVRMLIEDSLHDSLEYDEETEQELVSDDAFIAYVARTCRDACSWDEPDADTFYTVTKRLVDVRIEEFACAAAMASPTGKLSLTKCTVTITGLYEPCIRKALENLGFIPESKPGEYVGSTATFPCTIYQAIVLKRMLTRVSVHYFDRFTFTTTTPYAVHTYRIRNGSATPVVSLKKTDTVPRKK